MPRVAFVVPAVVLAGCIAFEDGGGRACDEPAACGTGNTCWQGQCVEVKPLAGDEKLEGKTRAQWATAWLQWLQAQDKTNHPLYDLTGEYCATGQPEDAFFLTGDDVTYGTNTTNRTCTVPAGRPIAFPVFWWEGDNNGRPPEDRYPDSELKQSVLAAVNGVTDLNVTFEGKTYRLADLTPLRIGLTQLDYTLPPKDHALLEPWEDQPREVSAWMDGFFVVLPPPPPGTYALHFGAKYIGNDGGPASTDSNYYLEVQ
jgi:hypothetical protein